MTRLVLLELFVTNLLLFEHQQKKMLVSWQFSGPYGVTKHGSGWRKDVVNQCLEFARRVNGRTDRQTDRPTDPRQSFVTRTSGLLSVQGVRQTNGCAGRQTDRQVDHLLGRLTDRLTNPTTVLRDKDIGILVSTGQTDKRMCGTTDR